MMAIKLTTVLLLLLGLCPLKTIAQKNIETQNLLWIRYALKLKLVDNYQIRLDIEERTYWFPWRQHQFVSRAFLERKLGKGWNAGLGFAYFIQSLPNDPYIADYLNQQELRPELEIAYTQTISDKFMIHHRFWTEFRFFEHLHDSFHYANNRTRYKLEVRYSLTPKLIVKAYDEIFINIGGKIVQNVFDQNRIGASLQYMPWELGGFELGYINWFQQRTSGIDFYDRHIVRFTVHHTLQLSN